ncbi:hypothetical protein ACJX0J_005627 [Zea mays]
MLDGNIKKYSFTGQKKEHMLAILEEDSKNEINNSKKVLLDPLKTLSQNPKGLIYNIKRMENSVNDILVDSAALAAMKLTNDICFLLEAFFFKTKKAEQICIF